MSEQGWKGFLAARGVDDVLDASVARERVETRHQAALAAGRIVDDSNAPEYWTLADRALPPDSPTVPADDR